ncbi:hypothetical protein HW932_19965 [Allochromatium humboldtianum]|uniref:Uncharacterized protein n=1 Tax=Allochromatium humboldtianum TaxID=504901 RepID=A0A850RKX5_9GAMM|nr:hypothetical protein [Allochromatium humboldtianum]NVZ11530.1 hypothetical protein [Allochromatium humboldtianum]
MEIFIGFLIVGTLFGHFLVSLQRHRARKRAQAEYKIRLAQQYEQLRDYMMDPDLLRGHDLVASIWLDMIRHQPPDPEMEGLVLAAATEIERHEGRHYEGRPIQRGWMTPQDYQDYFAFVDRFGCFQKRYAAVVRAKSALADR